MSWQEQQEKEIDEIIKHGTIPELLGKIAKLLVLLSEQIESLRGDVRDI